MTDKLAQKRGDQYITSELFVLAAMTITSGAHAACYYNGTGYQTGTQIGSLVCTPSGRWARP